MNNKQIRWAEQHDWFISSRNGKVKVRADLTTLEELLTEQNTQVFSNFQELREWAGY